MSCLTLRVYTFVGSSHHQHKLLTVLLFKWAVKIHWKKNQMSNGIYNIIHDCILHAYFKILFSWFIILRTLKSAVMVLKNTVSWNHFTKILQTCMLDFCSMNLALWLMWEGNKTRDLKMHPLFVGWMLLFKHCLQHLCTQCWKVWVCIDFTLCLGSNYYNV